MIASGARRININGQSLPRSICAACRSSLIGVQRDYWKSARSLAFHALGPSTPRLRGWPFPSHHQAPQPRFASKKSRPKNAEALYLPDYPVRTRFAPSPTGQLHIGGLRTALFSYLIAKRTGGQFILRIEDTDQKRLVPGAEQQLIEDLRWAGLSWDEGPDVGGPYGPYKQSSRNSIYHEHAEQLLERGEAYRCFCSAQTSQNDETAYVTSGCYQSCSSLSSDESHQRATQTKEPFTLRLKGPSRQSSYPDLVYDRITPLKRSPSATPGADSSAAGFATDTILVKSDGTPTYHFANVVDDHLMKITHVIRGTEWMASTPLHVDLYRAFGWEPPIFAHVGLLVNEEQAKLSKRDKDVALDVRGMHEQRRILPEALCNYLALLGWRFPGSNETCTMQDLVEKFTLKFTRGNAMVTMQKLTHLQKKHAQRRCKEANATGNGDLVEPILADIISEIELQNAEMSGSAMVKIPSDRALQVLLNESTHYENPRQFVEKYKYFFSFDSNLVPANDEYCVGQEKISRNEIHKIAVAVLRELDAKPPGGNVQLKGCIEASDQRAQAIGAAVDLAIRDASGVTGDAVNLRKALVLYLRQRLAYGKSGPSMEKTMAILGLEECCRRLEFATGGHSA